ncbi:hypothetical protein [Novilysobacter erysipheiresistens]|uniref:Uncharacterized protein n=1 Tax=Novilysobacter erysipheiresistens TaxID=1749332 RepID=A0ABU7YVX2_9GAMM
MTDNIWVRGEVLERALQVTGATNRWGRFRPDGRVRIDLAQHCYVLGIEHEHGFPFVVDNQMIATIHDFDAENEFRFAAHDQVVTVDGVSSTRRALESARVYFFSGVDHHTHSGVERLAQLLGMNASNDT